MRVLRGNNELKSIFFLAWPTMLEQLMQTTVQYIDTAMVGSQGTRATAAVGATGTLTWLICGAVSSLGIGFLSYIAQSLGAGDEQRARKAAAQSVTVMLTVGVFLTVFTQLCAGSIPVWMQVDPSIRDMAAGYFRILYIPILFRAASIIFGMVLRAAGDTRTPMRVGLIVNLINVVLNFFMIYPTRQSVLFGSPLTIPGAGWGINGAAAASAISFTFGGIAITAAFLRHKKISPIGQSFSPDRRILSVCFRITLPAFAQRFATGMGYVVFAAMINALGDVSTAAHTIANTVESAFYIPGWGMQSAAAVLAGNALGAGDHRRLRSISGMIIWIEVVLMVFSGGLLFAFAPELVRIFSKDPEILHLGTFVLRMVAISEPIYGVPIALEGVMQGMGQTLPSFLFNLTGMWGVRIVGTFICTRLLGMGLISAWGCMIGHNVLLFILFLIYYLKVLSGKGAKPGTMLE